MDVILAMARDAQIARTAQLLAARVTARAVELVVRAGQREVAHVVLRAHVAERPRRVAALAAGAVAPFVDGRLGVAPEAIAAHRLERHRRMARPARQRRMLAVDLEL